MHFTKMVDRSQSDPKSKSNGLEKIDPLFRISSARSESTGSEDGHEPANRVPFHLGGLYELIPGRLAFTVHRDQEHTRTEIHKRMKEVHYFSCDAQDLYEPFCSDFGPVKLSVVHKFCQFMHEKVTNPLLANRLLAYYCDNEPDSIANTAFLLGCYTMLFGDYTPEQAFASFSRISPCPIPRFRDATFRPADYTISLFDCFQGLSCAVSSGWYDPATFNVEEYDHWDNVDNGDLHLVTPKFVAFKGPASQARTMAGPTKTPQHTVAALLELKVGAVIRLNDKDTYDAACFTEHGIRHHDMFFEDCTAPSPRVIREFLDVCDQTKGRIAVHCMAGLGRTGTMIGLWMMKNLQWGADECIAWLRIVRPGSVIGAQQHFLKLCEGVSWHGNTPLLPSGWRSLLGKNAAADAAHFARAVEERRRASEPVATASADQKLEARRHSSGWAPAIRRRCVADAPTTPPARHVARGFVAPSKNSQ